jgi:hypothetical protein
MTEPYKNLIHGDHKIARMAGRALVDAAFAKEALRDPASAATKIPGLGNIDADQIAAIKRINAEEALRLLEQLRPLLPAVEGFDADAVSW